MTINEEIHDVYKALKHRLLFQEAQEFGISDDFAEVYFAERDLYIVHDKTDDSYHFYIAESPTDAYLKMLDDIRSSYE